MPSTIYDYIGAANPATYELENSIADPDCLIEAHMETVAPLDGAVMLDIGAGSGFHTSRFAKCAAHVFAVEPDPDMQKLFHSRFDGPHPNVSLMAAHAEDIPLEDASIDIAHARFAYFFGTEGNCEAGIIEAKRLLKPGGHFFIIDNCYSEGQFATFCEMAYGRGPKLQQTNENFYQNHGFDVSRVHSYWRAPDRDALKQVIAMEFPKKHVESIMRDINGVELSYVYTIYHYRK